MKNRWLLTFLLSFSLFAQEGTQLTVFNDHQFQPEVYSFPKLVEAGVDAKGDLNLSIPVLSVPGRNGLDYNINFSYQSGITVEAEASWVGLGWNFNAGGITRDVRGHVNGVYDLYDPDLLNPIYGVDYDRIPDQMPDAYFVTIPGRGTFEMVRSNKIGFNQSPVGPTGFIAPYNENGFYFIDNQPFKVEFEVDNYTKGEFEYSDFSRFIITTDDGMRYVYGQPTKGYHGDLSLWLDSKREYNSAWRLVAVLDPNCPDLTEYDLEPGQELTLANIKSISHEGNWLFFDYDVFTAGDNATRSFLRNVYTPTHRAHFVIANDRIDWTNDYPLLAKKRTYIISNSRRLSEIHLYNAISDHLMRKVVLNQDNSLAELYQIGGEYILEDGKLTLKSFHFVGSNGEVEPGYKFHYAYNPIVIYNMEYMDAFGFYNTAEILETSGILPFEWKEESRGEFQGPEENHDGSAWSLTQITYPTGAREEYYYQNDVVHVDAHDNTAGRVYLNDNYEQNGFMIPYDFTFAADDGNIVDPDGEIVQYVHHGDLSVGGGARITRMVRLDKDDNIKRQKEFIYGNGRASGIPTKVLPYLFWQWGPSGIMPAYNMDQTRGKLGVFYDHITIVTTSDAENSIQYNKYLTSHTGGEANLAGAVRTQGAIMLRNGSRWLTIADEQQGPWGRIYESSLKPAGATGYATKTKIIFSPQIQNRVMANLLDSDYATNGHPLYLDQHFSVVVRKEIEESYSLSGQTGKPFNTTIEYEYDPVTLQPVKVTETTDSDRITTYTTYLHSELAGTATWDWGDALTGPRLYNQLNTTYSSYQTREKRDANGWQTPIVTAADFSAFKDINISANYENWQLDRTYTLNLPDHPETLPAFVERDSDDGNDVPWKLTNKISSYDQYGQIRETEDVLGQKLRLYYGNNTAPLSNTNDFASAYITGLQFESNGKTISQRVKYDENIMRANAIIDENDVKVSFAYDGLQRLVESRNNNGDLLSRNSYAFSRNGNSDSQYDPVNPNQVITETFVEQNDGVHTLLQKQFFDEFGHMAQTLVKPSEEYSIVSAFATNAKGMAKEAYKNYDYKGQDNYDSQYFRRFPNGDLFNLPHHSDDVKAAFNYPGTPPAASKTILLDLLTSPEIKFNWVTNFFNMSGEATITVSTRKNGNVIETITKNHQYNKPGDGKFYFETFTELIEMDRGEATHLEVIVETTGLPSGLGKQYVYSRASLQDMNTFYVFREDYQYYPNSDVQTKTIFPLENGKRESVNSTILSKYENELSFPGVFTNATLYDTTYEEVTIGNIKAIIRRIEELDPITIRFDEEMFTVANEVEVTISWQTYFGGAAHDHFSCHLKFEEVSSPANILLLDDHSDVNHTHYYTLILSPNKTYRAYTNITGVVDLFEDFSVESLLSIKYQNVVPVAQTIEIPLKLITNSNEIGQVTQSYSSPAGEKIADIQRDENGRNITTSYNYDITGNLTKVYHPNYFNPPAGSVAEDWITEYKYNTLGQMLWKDTPDDARTEYRYDRAGRLRFSQNAQQRLEGKVSFTTYDFAGRILTAGEGCATWSALNPDATHSFETNGNNIFGRYLYDDQPDAAYINAIGVSSSLVTSGLSFSNPIGHLTAAAYRSNGQWEVELYSYDNENRVSHKRLLTQNVGTVDWLQSDLTYQYNRQGQITQKSSSVNGQTFYTFYEYDGLMQLWKVYSSRSDVQPSLADATYNYNVQGLVESITYHGPNGNMTVPYEYNLRDWVTDIGAGSNPFEANYTYEANGNIKIAEYQNKQSALQPHFKYEYAYDGLNRLLSADYFHYSGGWQDVNAFSVENFDYDDMGNILGLKRYGKNSEVIDELTYTYGQGNSWLSSVSDARNSLYGWDAEDTQYGYDLIGNVTTVYRQNSNETRTLTMNPINLPERITIDKAGQGPHLVEYRYNLAGQRIVKDNQGEIEFYLMDGDVNLGVFDADGKVIYWNIYGNDLIGRYQP
jgi:hypothetical protein